MDIVFDIDGTLADATHRLHFIKDTDFFLVDRVGSEDTGWRDVLKPDWDSFLSDEQVSKDAPIPQTWDLLTHILQKPHTHRVIFITGRPERSHQMTFTWLANPTCLVRRPAYEAWEANVDEIGFPFGPRIYMRSDGDHRPSDVVKRELLHRARAEGYKPTLVFEDRKDDTAMWRSEGLLCCQVAEGDY